jgi:hypothetical protein
MKFKKKLLPMMAGFFVTGVAWSATPSVMVITPGSTVRACSTIT